MNRVYDLHRLNGFYILNTKPVLKFSGLKKYYSTGSIEKDSFEYVTYENRPSRANLQPEEGCLIFAKMSNTTKTIYIDNELKENIYSTGFFSIKPKNINYEYLFYLLECTEFLQEKDSYSNGTTQFSINENNLKKIKVHLTTFKDEQTRIVKAIKAKEEKINALITNEEKQIEKLKVYKQALISEVVTKGLDPNVPMKDSGIFSIGYIPYSWEVKKVKFIIDSITKGSGITKESVSLEGDSECIRYGEIYTRYNISFDTCFSKTIEKNVSSKIYAEHGDLLFAGTGELIEEIGKNIVYLGNNKILVGGDIIIAKHHKNAEYLNYSLYSYASQAQKSKGKAKLKVVHISADEIKNIYIALAPESEQTKIVACLDKKVTLLDKVIKCHLNKIEKLKAYRKSMIYEYVTGKRKVY